MRAFAEALEVIPYTLAENAGLNPIQIVTELRNKHASGMKAAGINVRRSAGLRLWARPPPCHIMQAGAELGLLHNICGCVCRMSSWTCGHWFKQDC